MNLEAHFSIRFPKTSLSFSIFTFALVDVISTYLTEDVEDEDVELTMEMCDSSLSIVTSVLLVN